MKITNPLSKNAFQEFADQHSLVYSSKFEDDAHTVVRGVTLSNARKDEYLVQGHIEGHDIQLLQRQISMKKPGNQMMVLKWAIMHLSLIGSENLPHVFLDGKNRYHEDVYEMIFTKFHKLVLVPPPYGGSFMSQYRIFANPETAPQLHTILNTEMTEKLSTLGHIMDYELFENGVYVYLPGGAESIDDLNSMLTAIKVLGSGVT